MIHRGVRGDWYMNGVRVVSGTWRGEGVSDTWKG